MEFTIQEASKFPEGAVLVKTWGYEQTNVDFCRVYRNTGKTLQCEPLKSKTVTEKDMIGTAVPTKETDGDERKFGLRIRPYSREEPDRAYLQGWEPWTGKPVGFTSYG